MGLTPQRSISSESTARADQGIGARVLQGTAAIVALALVMVGIPTGAVFAADATRINLRVLVITAGDETADPSTAAIATQLDREGVPYTKVNALAAGRATIDAAFLADSATSTAKYQAVVVKDHAGGGLSTAELAALTAYERQYGIRQVDAFNFPNTDVGLGAPSYSGALDGGTATVTAAGLAGPFGYLNGSLKIDDYDTTVNEVPGYLAQANPAPAVGETFTPLVTATVGANSGVLIGVDTRDGREELTISAGYNASQLWWNEVAHGVVTWMTRGIHVGYQRNWFNVQVDDLFLPDSRWSASGNCTPGDGCVDPNVTTTDIRMVPADVTKLIAWQNANNFKLDMVFNGGGTGIWYQSLNPDSTLTFDQANATADPLRDAFLANKAEFPWINHTYTHIFLGCIQLAPTVIGAQYTCAKTATDTPRQDEEIPGTEKDGTFWASQQALSDQIQKNIDWATAHALPNFDSTELVTGEHSGLLTLPQQPVDNPFLAPALAASGIKFTASDNSRESSQRTVQGGSTLTVPRYPFNVFYNAGTYLDEVDEYNWIYVSRNNATQPGGGVCDDNPTTSTCIEPLPAANEAQAKASFDSYIKPLEIRNALTKVTANSPRPFYAHQSNLAESGILYPVVEGILSQYRAVYASNAPIVQSDLTDQGVQLQRSAAWAGISGSTNAYLDSTGVHVPDAAADIPLTMPAGSTTTGATLASYGGELSSWLSGAATSVPPTAMGGYTPSPAVTSPDSPTAVTATAGDTVATINWTAPVSNGGTPLNGYFITATAGNGTTIERFAAPTATSLVFDGLTNGMPYTFTVLAQNDRFLRSAPSAPTASVTPGANLPTAPTGVTATAADRSATVSWTASSYTGATPLNAYLVYTTTGGVTTGPAYVTPVNGVMPLTYTVTGLTNGTAYTFTVVAQNESFKTSAPSEPTAPVTPTAALPTAPRDVTATAGNASATVNWTGPLSDGGANLTGYVVNAYAAGSTTAAPVTTVAGGGSTSALVQGLTNGTSYTFTVAAVSTVGTGAASAPSSAVIPVTTASAPTITSVTGGDSAAGVTWTAPDSTGGSPITGWEVQAFAAGSTTPVGAVTIDNATLSARVSGLTNGTTYTLTVAAKNAQGTGTAATSGPVTPVAPTVVPGAPTITSTTAGSAQVTVAWTPPADGTAAAITGYTVTAYESTGTTAITTVSAGAAATSAIVTGLTNGTAYTFTVTGLNGVTAGTASARSEAATPAAAVTVPGAPGIGTATAGHGDAAITWSAPTSNGGSAITGYTVTASTGGAVATTVQAAADATTATVSGLTNGTAYTFTVAAINAQGTGTASAPSAPVTPTALAAPGAPTFATVVGGPGQVKLVWNPPTTVGSSAVTGYTVRAFEGSGTTPVTTATTDGTTLTATITGLTNGTVYTFTVTADNAVGAGVESARSASVTPAGVPGAPTIGTAVAGAASATVSWTPSSDTGGSPVTGYVVSVFTGTGTTATKTVPVAASATSLSVTGLTNGTAYRFSVAATNTVGTGTASATSNAVTPTAALALPGAPTIGAATAGNGTATVNWTAPAQAGTSAISGYTVTVYSGTGSTVVKTSTAAATATSLAITGLTNGTAYTFTVAASNATGAGPASARSASVTPATLPGVPRAVAVTPSSASAIVLWTAPTSNGGTPITGYTITVYTNSGTLVKTVSAPATPTWATVTGLANGTSYRFTVAAVTAAGTGEASAKTNAVTPVGQAGAPKIGTATAGANSATVKWTAPAAQAGTPAITGYAIAVFVGDSGSLTRYVLAGRTATSATVTGLTAGVGYSFRVVALTATGTSAPSDRSNTVTPTAPIVKPGAPTIGTATAGNASATVTWRAPSSTGGAALTGYVVSVYRSGSTSVVKTVSVNGTTLQARVTGLVNGTKYTFRVAAVNSAGTGAQSGSSSVVTPKA